MTTLNVLGFDVGGSKISMFLTDSSGKVHKRARIKTPVFENPQQLIDLLGDMADTVEKDTGMIPDSIAVVIAGAVDAVRGILRSSPNLFGDKEVHLSSMLEKRLKKVVYIENDATAVAISEKVFGNGKGFENFLYITLSTGIGGGIFINNKVYRGALGMAAEFGHVVMDPQGPLCGCGRRGCFEAIAGGRGTMKLMEEMGSYSRSPYLQKIDRQKMEAKDIFAGAEVRDEECIAVVERVVKNMVSGIANLVNIFDPEAIMIGGGLANSRELVIDRIEKDLPEALKSMRRNIQIRKTNPITVELSPLAVVLNEHETPAFNYERIVREMREKLSERM